MFKASSPADRSRLILPDIAAIARNTSFILRRRKLTADAFLQSLLAAVALGNASLNQIADSIRHYTGKSFTPQSLHEHLGPQSERFLMITLIYLTEQRYFPVRKTLGNTPILRLLVEDCTALAINKANADNFPAHGNRHGATAGAKIDFTYDILSGNVISHSLNYAAEQDKVIGKDLIAEIQPGDCVLRDMGFFITSEFEKIEARQGFWITRLPMTVNIDLECGRGLEKHLRNAGKATRIDVTAFIGAEKKQCRLIAIRATKAIASKRRRERRERAKELGKTPCPKGLERDGWHIMLTNLTNDQATLDQLVSIYRVRWAIEIQFRAWKQALNLEQALDRKSNEFHLKALLLAAMIAHQLGLKLGIVMEELVGGIERLSYEKLYDLLAPQLIRTESFAALSSYRPAPNLVRRNKRNQKSTINQGLAS